MEIDSHKRENNFLKPSFDFTLATVHSDQSVRTALPVIPPLIVGIACFQAIIDLVKPIISSVCAPGAAETLRLLVRSRNYTPIARFGPPSAMRHMSPPPEDLLETK